MTIATHDLAAERVRAVPSFGVRAMMLSGGLLGAMALVAITAVLPKIEIALAHWAGEGLLIKQLVGIVSLAMVVGAPLSGILVDRVGLRPILFAAVLLYVAAGTAGLYLDGLPALLASRFLLGLAAASVQIISSTLINTRLAGGDRAKWIGWHMALAMVGTIFVNPIAGLLGEISWRLPFALYGVALLLLPIVVLDRTLRQPARHCPPRQGAEAHGTVEAGERRGLLGWFPLHYALLAVFIGGITYVPFIYVPFLLRAHGLASPSLIGLVLTTDSVFGAVMATMYGGARRHLSANAAFAVSFAATGSGTFAAALSPGVGGVVAGMAMFGFGAGWFVANLLTALAAKIATERQGRATGYIKAAHFLSAPLCVLLAEPVSRHYGPQGVMLVVSLAAFALLGLMLARIAETRRRSVRLRKQRLRDQ